MFKNIHPADSCLHFINDTTQVMVGLFSASYPSSLIYKYSTISRQLNHTPPFHENGRTAVL